MLGAGGVVLVGAGWVVLGGWCCLCCWVLLGGAGCCWVLLGAPGCCWVLLGATGCCWVVGEEEGGGLWMWLGWVVLGGAGW